ncbi:MAG: gliding motility-associated C-terminal domain-containing protein [Bacteroidota bacterium]
MPRLLIVFLFGLTQVGQLGLLAQSCTGNLGENIFAEGDFGSGTANLLATDPGIAPGYIYTTVVPPEDGFYTITNNTAAWPGLFPSWLRIGDRSTDPNGYMMVVNASFDTGLFYEQEINGLCDNTTYLFSADVINLIRSSVTGHIAPNISFLIDGVEQFTTGNIPQSELWDNYGFAFTTLPGQNSVVLSLRNNAPGGIGNDLALDNISFRPCGPIARVAGPSQFGICEGQTSVELVAAISGEQFDDPAIQWQQSFDNGQSWQNIVGANDPILNATVLPADAYRFRYLLANNPFNLLSALCRVVSTEIIVDVIPREVFISDTICEGGTYLIGNSSYTATGLYRDSLVSSLNCDSIVNLDLVVLSQPEINVSLDIDQPVCGDDLGAVTITEITGGNPPYLTLIAGELSDTIGLALGPVSTPIGNYGVFVTDRFGCSAVAPFSIQASAPFDVDLGPDRSVRLGEELAIDVDASAPVANFNWSPFSPSCPNDCLPAIFNPPGSGFLTLIAESEDGCLATDSVFIEVRPLRQVYVPNAFSPNNDGVNDAFAPIIIQPNVSSILRFEVYDRWGNQVYAQADWLPRGISDGWDGQIRGKLAPTGVYVYQAEVLFLDGEVLIYKGDVQLLR